MSVQKPEGSTLLTVLAAETKVIITYISDAGLWFSWSPSYNGLCIPFKQNEENKKKSKRAALKAQLDLEEARKAASQATEQQENNNISLQNLEGRTYEWVKWKWNTRIFVMG